MSKSIKKRSAAKSRTRKKSSGKYRKGHLARVLSINFGDWWLTKETKLSGCTLGSYNEKKLVDFVRKITKQKKVAA